MTPPPHHYRTYLDDGIITVFDGDFVPLDGADRDVALAVTVRAIIADNPDRFDDALDELGGSPCDEDNVLPPGSYDHVTIEWPGAELRTITVNDDPDA